MNGMGEEDQDVDMNQLMKEMDMNEVNDDGYFIS